MLATDIPTTLLVIGILVLCATTAITTLALPSFPFPRRDRRRARGGRRFDDPQDTMLIPAPYRRPVTGRARSEPPLELPPAARQFDGDPDGRLTSGDLAAAEAFIEYLLEYEPEQLAELMKHWIRADERAAREHTTS